MNPYSSLPLSPIPRRPPSRDTAVGRAIPCLGCLGGIGLFPVFVMKKKPMYRLSENVEVYDKSIDQWYGAKISEIVQSREGVLYHVRGKYDGKFFETRFTPPDRIRSLEIYNEDSDGEDCLDTPFPSTATSPRPSESPSPQKNRSTLKAIERKSLPNKAQRKHLRRKRKEKPSCASRKRKKPSDLGSRKAWTGWDKHGSPSKARSDHGLDLDEEAEGSLGSEGNVRISEEKVLGSDRDVSDSRKNEVGKNAQNQRTGSLLASRDKGGTVDSGKNGANVLDSGKRASGFYQRKRRHRVPKNVARQIRSFLAIVYTKICETDFIELITDPNLDLDFPLNIVKEVEKESMKKWGRLLTPSERQYCKRQAPMIKEKCFSVDKKPGSVTRKRAPAARSKQNRRMKPLELLSRIDRDIASGSSDDEVITSLIRKKAFPQSSTKAFPSPSRNRRGPRARNLPPSSKISSPPHSDDEVIMLMTRGKKHVTRSPNKGFPPASENRRRSRERMLPQSPKTSCPPISSDDEAIMSLARKKTFPQSSNKRFASCSENSIFRSERDSLSSQKIGSTSQSEHLTSDDDEPIMSITRKKSFPPSSNKGFPPSSKNGLPLRSKKSFPPNWNDFSPPPEDYLSPTQLGDILSAKSSTTDILDSGGSVKTNTLNFPLWKGLINIFDQEQHYSGRVLLGDPMVLPSKLTISSKFRWRYAWSRYLRNALQSYRFGNQGIVGIVELEIAYHSWDAKVKETIRKSQVLNTSQEGNIVLLYGELSNEGRKGYEMLKIEFFLRRSLKPRTLYLFVLSADSASGL
ncbi:hypothetical protein AAMO2058_000303800 [Amorphochlora amoebiformis]